MSDTSAITEPIARPENANLCLLLARAFSSPRDFQPEQAHSCRELVSALPAKQAAKGLALAEEWERALHDPDPVLLAYSRLFVGPFEIQAPPYASQYLEPDQRLMGKVSMWVAETYADSGLDRGDGPIEAPDHIALEWEYLYYLGYQAITLKSSEWTVRAKSFIEEHMIKWTPRLVKSILASETHSFYHALARFSSSFLRSLRTDSPL